ncbi:hypothetical protein [Streptomyces sp. NPDC048551]|uniref:hypothetical protein n=1 Tax=Streptomyces sp. NPDC048551 TaxID=3155758 RepID=UPI00341BC54A
MSGRPCDIPGPSHDGTARLYPCGWRCTSHAPQARTTTPTGTAPATVTRLRARTTRREPLRVVAVLLIDSGEGYATKDAGPGEFTWKTHPRARYECVACAWRSETVTGSVAVLNFLNHIRATHKAVCKAAATEGARAA